MRKREHDRRTRVSVGGAALLVAMFAMGCGGGRASVSERGPSLPPIGALSTIVPRGATTVIVARPTALLSAPATRTVVEPLLTPDLVAGLERRTSIDIRRVHELVVAEYPTGVVAIARGAFSAPTNVRTLATRMISVETSSDRPFLRRAGYIGNDLREAVALAADVFAVGEGNVGPHMAALLERVRLGAWGPGMKSALDSPDGSALVAAHGGAPLVVYVPEPLDIPPEVGTGMLLARERALAFSATPSGPGHVQVDLTFRGEFPDGAEQNFQALVSSLGMSDLGAALGIAEARETLRVQTDAHAAVLQMKLAAGVLGRALRVLLVAELREAVEGASTLQ